MAFRKLAEKLLNERLAASNDKKEDVDDLMEGNLSAELKTKSTSKKDSKSMKKSMKRKHEFSSDLMEDLDIFELEDSADWATPEPRRVSSSSKEEEDEKGFIDPQVFAALPPEIQEEIMKDLRKPKTPKKSKTSQYESPISFFRYFELLQFGNP